MNIERMVFRYDSASEERKHFRTETVYNEWYCRQMNQIVPNVLAKCEKIVGVQAGEWYIKNMRTKWGTCNIEQKRI